MIPWDRISEDRMSQSGFHLRSMQPEDRDEIARLIYHSTNAYYESIGRDRIFQGDELQPGEMFDVYQQIDPGEGIVAVDDATQQIIGSCFVHPRETHFSLGIMNAHADHFGRGVARTILAEIIRRAQEQQKPIRLVSSCFNLDSYSLYTRAGFVPFATYQDMFLEVPEAGLPFDPPNDIGVRPAELSDIDAIGELEQQVSGITRVSDYRYFIENPDGLWTGFVAESQTGISGFLVSCGSETVNMIGPGVATDSATAEALFYAQLNANRGRCPVLLAQVNCGQLVKRLYQWGARNCEMHVAQSHGPASAPNGVVMPTFLPETG